MVGLNHPVDVDAWQRWQDSQGRLVRTLRKLKHRNADANFSYTIYSHGSRPRVLSVVETSSPTAVAAQLSWLAMLDVDYAVAAPSGMGQTFDAQVEQTVVSSLEEFPALDHIQAVAAWGHYLPIGKDAYAVTRARGIAFYVIQHGLLTALNPPLPAGAHLLAWSEADAEFWKSGRDDVTSSVVGSQLLWNAAQGEAVDLDHDSPLTYLGQLHGAELPQLRNFISATRFCLKTGAHYRPHPGEKDLGSRLLHKVMKRVGVTFADTSIPVNQLRSPIVSAFSTGVLEAAAKGLPAYVHFDAPPAWLKEFWVRYGMSRYETGQPTPAPEVPQVEPAAAIAAELRKAVSE